MMQKHTALGTAAAIALALGGVIPAAAQNVSDKFDPGSSLQSWQDPGLAALRSECHNPAPAFSFPPAPANPEPARPSPLPPPSTAIPGIIAAGQEWQTVWSWRGNNADGMIATDDGGVMFANNNASNVIHVSADGSSAEIVHADTNTGGAVSRSKTGVLFVLERGLHSAIEQLEPERRMFADSFEGDPLDCVGGVMNDLVADSRGGVYFTVSGAGLFYADPTGTVHEYGDSMAATNGIILSRDEQTLYVTNGPVVVAFDVEADGSLTNQRDFAMMSAGGGDGMAVDSEGRLYVSNGAGADVFSTTGMLLGHIAGPEGMHGVAFSGPGKRMLYGIVFNGTIGGTNSVNRVVRIPMLASGYAGRAK